MKIVMIFMVLFTGLLALACVFGAFDRPRRPLETAASATHASRVSVDGEQLGNLFYFRDDASRQCFALFMSRVYPAIVVVPCGDVQWR